MQKIFWCKTCLAMSTRRRITFNEQGQCSACQWKLRKESLNWGTREKQLRELLDKHRSSRGEFDCIVPVSGGKDGSYVAYNLKNKYGMNPLCVTVTPPLQLELGKRNIEKFIESGFSLISISTNPETMRFFNKKGLINIGFPYYGWLTAIQTIPPSIAMKFGINLIFYGEDGEVEYGGSSETADNPIYNFKYMKEIYLENQSYNSFESMLDDANKKKLRDVEWFQFPKNGNEENLEITHWSYFENWDPYRNYLVAKEFCGLQENESVNSGTFTNFAQNDQALYSLHTYLMFLKYGFGRANQDASIEIRRGALSRDQAINLVKLYDGLFPEQYLELYLNYYQMKKEDFLKVLDSWANKDILEKIDNKWQLRMEII